MLDTLIRPTPRRTPNRQIVYFFFDNQPATLLEDQKSGSAWRGDDDPLARLQSSARQLGRQSGGRADVYAYQSAIDIYYALPKVCRWRVITAATLPCCYRIER